VVVAPTRADEGAVDRRGDEQHPKKHLGKAKCTTKRKKTHKVTYEICRSDFPSSFMVTGQVAGW
jgi:hypothetical protein